MTRPARTPADLYPPGTRLNVYRVATGHTHAVVVLEHRTPFGREPYALVRHLDAPRLHGRIPHRHLAPPLVTVLEPAGDDPTRCTATTRTGDRCRNRTRPDLDRCTNHR